MPGWAIWSTGLLLFMILSKVEVFFLKIMSYYCITCMGCCFIEILFRNGSSNHCPGYTSVWYLWDCYYTQLLRFLSCLPVQAMHRRTHLRWISKPCNSPVWRTKINLDLSEMSNTSTKSCDLHCKDCNIHICTFCLGSKQHKGHDIRVLDDIYKEKKETILKEGNELKKLNFSEIRRNDSWFRKTDCQFG